MIEVIVVTIVIGVMAAAGATRMNKAARQIQADYEAKRLLMVLRGCKELAMDGGPAAVPPPGVNYGYGVFFWGHPNPVNPAAPLCYEYSPYVPVSHTIPNWGMNAIGRLPTMGLPDQPLELGLRSDQERQSLSADQAAEGMQIYFQTDAMGQPDYYPAAQRTYWPPAPPPVGVAISPLPANSWNTTRVVFWPRGERLPGSWWPQAWWTPASGSLPGVTLPTTAGDTIIYNRIYVRADSDVDITSKWQPTTVRNIPKRIWINPTTGVMRLMAPYERRPDGSW